MVYKNTKTGETGNLYKLLPNVSNAIKLTEEQLKELNIEKVQPVPKPEPTLEEMKKQKNKEIKQNLSQIRNEGFDTSFGFKIDITKEHFDLFKDVKLLLEETGSTETEVRDYNNQFHVLTKSDYDSLVLEAGIYINQLLKEKWILNKEVDSATTKKEVEKIYWRKPIYVDEMEMEISGYEYNPILNRGV